MTKSSSMDTLEIEVKNFGPITEAKIDLRPLTLFIGPSNSGKSYLSILIYALHRALSREYSGLYSGRRFKGEFSKENISKLQDWLGSNIGTLRAGPLTKRSPISKRKSFELSEKISELVRQTLDDPSQFGAAIKDEIERCFGTDSIQSLIHRTGSKRKVATNKAVVTLKKSTTSSQSPAELLMCNFELNAKNPRGFLRIPSDVPLRIGLPHDDGSAVYLHRYLSGVFYKSPSRGESKDSYHQMIGEGLVNAVFFNSISSIGRSAHYLPADRTGVMHAHRIIVNAAMERATRAGIHPLSNVPVLSGVVADFLKQLVRINDGSIALERHKWRMFSHSRYLRGETHRKHRRLLEETATNLELEVLGGDVRSEEPDNQLPSYPDFSYTPRGWSDSLPLMLASSMVSELSSVVMYLRRVLVPGDVLIIEEPEAHLHPNLQIEFVNVLAEIVKARVQIIMTTHSVWILDAVANLVLSSETSELSDNDADVVLSRENVGVWSFNMKNRPKGSVVQEIKFDPDEGGYVTEFDEAATNLHNNWVRIDRRSNKKNEELSDE